jgi:hypothetical protein
MDAGRRRPGHARVRTHRKETHLQCSTHFVRSINISLPQHDGPSDCSICPFLPYRSSFALADRCTANAEVNRGALWQILKDSYHAQWDAEATSYRVGRDEGGRIDDLNTQNPADDTFIFVDAGNGRFVVQADHPPL